KGEIHHKPEPIPYPQNRIRFKHYGHIAEKMIQKAVAQADEESRAKMALAIANFMKMAYLTWNKDSVNDLQIILDLADMSGGILRLPEDTVLTKLDFKTPPPGSRVKNTQNTQSNQKSATNKKQNTNNNKKKQHQNNGKKSFQHSNYKK